MYCTKCGQKLDDDAKFCTRCGAPTGFEVQTEIKNQTNVKNVKEKPAEKHNFWFGLLSVLFPLVGLILFIVWIKEKPRRSKVCGICALVAFIAEIIMGIIIGVFAGLFLYYNGVQYDPVPDNGNSSQNDNGNSSQNTENVVKPAPMPVYELSEDGVFAYTSFGAGKSACYDVTSDILVVWSKYTVSAYDMQNNTVLFTSEYDKLISSVSVYNGTMCIAFGNQSRLIIIYDFNTGESTTVMGLSDIAEIIVCDGMAVYCGGNQFCDIFKLDFTDKSQTSMLSMIYQPKLWVNYDENILYAAETGLSSCDFYYIGLNDNSVKSLAEFDDYRANEESPYYDGEQVHFFGNTYDAVTGEILSTLGYTEPIRPIDETLSMTLFRNEFISLISTTDGTLLLYDRVNGERAYTIQLAATIIYDLGDNTFCAVCGTSGVVAFIDLKSIPEKEEEQPVEIPYKDTEDGVVTFSCYGEGTNVCYDKSCDGIIVWDKYDVVVYDGQSGNERFTFTFMLEISDVSVYNGVLCVGFGGVVRKIAICDLTTGESYMLYTLCVVDDVLVCDNSVVYCCSDQWDEIYVIDLSDYSQTLLMDFVYAPTLAANYEQNILYVAETVGSTGELYYFDLNTFEQLFYAERVNVYNREGVYFDGECVHLNGKTYDAVTGECISSNGYVENIDPADDTLLMTVFSNGSISFIRTIDDRTIVYDRASGEVVYTLQFTVTAAYAFGENTYLAVCGDSGYVALVDLNLI